MRKIESQHTQLISDNAKLFYLLQVTDPTFPIGAYSHSLGFETYMVNRIVSTPEETKAYLESNLQSSFLYGDLLAASLAYDYAQAENVGALLHLDEIIRAVKNPREIREASEKLGSRFVKTVVKMMPEIQTTIFKDYLDQAQTQKCATNYAVVYGISCAVLGIDKTLSLSAFLYTNTSGVITNAAKSVPISQTSGQMIMAELYPLFGSLIQQVKELTEKDLGMAVPGFDIRSMQHEVLYTRIYIS